MVFPSIYSGHGEEAILLLHPTELCVSVDLPPPYSNLFPGPSPWAVADSPLSPSVLPNPDKDT